MPGNLASIPPSVIASWPTPNYVDPVRRTWMPAYAGTLQVVATILVATRLWLRARKQAGPLGLDDALLIPAFLGGTMFSTLAIIACVNYGVDRHTWDVPPTEFEGTALIAWLSEFSFLISTCSTKVSVLLFYRRLTGGSISKKWKMATIAAIVFTCLYGVAFILALIFNCWPTEAYWKAYNPTYTKNYYCANTRSLNPVSGTLSVFSDLYSVILPIAIMWRFETTRQKKIALNAVFSLGLLVVIAGAVRTYYLSQLGWKYDITWLSFDVLVWAQLEVQLAIICASAPALRVFFRKYLSDPISRAIHTASSISRSAIDRSTNRDSRQPDSAGVLSFSREQPERSESRMTEEKREVKTTLQTVHEQDMESSSQAESSQRSPIKTADDFEAYALQNLERSRVHAHRWTLSRPSVDEEIRGNLSGPFSEPRVPKSWLETD